MLQRVITFCLRFHNSFSSEKRCDNLSVDKLLNSMKVIIKHLQNKCFSISNDSIDLTYLTPGYFLVGDSLTAFPEKNITNVSKIA